jgi:hypothetical protein
MLQMRTNLLQLTLCITLAGLPWPVPLRAQQITREQLLALTPDETDLPGFVRIQPADEKPPAGNTHFPARPLEDRIRLNVNLAESTRSRTGIVSSISRALYSTDDVFRMSMKVILCDSVDTAHQELLAPFGNARPSPGMFGGRPSIGDESWYYHFSDSNTLVIRLGRSVIHLEGCLSNVASRQGVRAEFPALAVEAVANMILLRLAKHPELTGVKTESLTVTVNGSPLSQAPVAVGGRVFVSVLGAAKAAGMECAWDAKTGNLTLSRGTERPVALIAGVSLANVNAVSKGSLRAFVLKEAGQPVMELQDLVRLLKGKVVKREGGKLEVTL